MILYPTETIYALGVNALDEGELFRLFQLKQRDESQTVSWLVRGVGDIERYAVVSERAAAIASQWLPGPLTLVLPARDEVSRRLTRFDHTIAFRISSDPVAQKLISDFMIENNAPLTCTSANISGRPTLTTPHEIMIQFADEAAQIDKVIDDGPRTAPASTIVRVLGEEVTVLREGSIKTAELLQM